MSFSQKEFSSMPPRPKQGASATEAYPWHSIAPGIWEHQLNFSNPGESSVVQWFEPNAKSPSNDVITHDYIEEVILIEGSLRDLTLEQEWGPGAYAYRLPGMPHGPYQAGIHGCLEFVRCVPVVKGPR
ncbi:hypothetical protein BDP27DRAFT_1316957 [Rhodocollybia butyracea]|uniref:ChrR-like cupin domain-containing protein n=1 Tax=Rhodocollybia butyracea TaxID=206335 RepID=A0A9P5Q461_9AGAR|nr:hypothetical protein BDP27DRAFT_1316957 [Rhodocollybia butyracea]